MNLYECEKYKQTITCMRYPNDNKSDNKFSRKPGYQQRFSHFSYSEESYSEIPGDRSGNRYSAATCPDSAGAVRA